MKINIANPIIGQEEIDAVARVMRTGSLAQGAEVLEFENEFAEFIGSKYAVATSNGSTALLVGLMALGIEPGSEVITTPFTFLASATSIIFAGLKPVFVDILDDTFCINPDLIEAAITSKTKAIMPVHLYGNVAEMDKIKEIANKHNLYVIEDCAQSHGAKYNGFSSGSIGDLGCFSFYPTKNMTTGEGGMITTNSEKIANVCRLIRAHGMSAPYQYDVLGFNYRMTNISAAIGREQLKKLPNWNKSRNNNANYYNSNLNNVVVPHKKENIEHVYHQYTIKCKDPAGLKKYLLDNDVVSGTYYPDPLYKFDILKDYSAECPVSESVSKSVISLSVHSGLSTNDLERVVYLVNKFCENH